MDLDAPNSPTPEEWVAYLRYKRWQDRISPDSRPRLSQRTYLYFIALARPEDVSHPLTCCRFPRAPFVAWLQVPRLTDGGFQCESSKSLNTSRWTG
jgi:hypothetical protein